MTSAIALTGENGTIIEASVDLGGGVVIDATIGSGTPHKLFTVGQKAHAMRIIGAFDAGDPDLPPADFDLTIGVVGAELGQFTVYLPMTTSQLLSYQVTSVGMDPDTLSDNIDVFSETEPTVSFTDRGSTRLVLTNWEIGRDNQSSTRLSPRKSR